MLVLALDTATPTVLAAVVQLLLPHELGETTQPLSTLAEHTVTDRFGHAEHLMPLVTAALAEADRDIGELDAVVVGVGPGPYTGLRVGIATAAALGDALDVPVHGVASHDAWARRAFANGTSEAPGALVVVTDARRREIYFSGYDVSGRRVFGPAVAAPAAVVGLLADAGVTADSLAGPGADLLAEVLPLPARATVGPLGQHLVAAAARALVTGTVPGPIEPDYLRRPDVDEPGAPKPVLPAEPSEPSEPAVPAVPRGSKATEL